MSVTKALCEKITSMTGNDLDEETRALARRLILDGMAVAVAGAAIEQAPVVLADYFRSQQGRQEASLLGQSGGLPAAQAALVNGAAMHVLDFEPMWLPSTHALSPALAAALALAETHGASGLDLMAAVIKGIELQMVLLASRGHVESRNLRFHPPGMVGPLGATVAAAHILGLDADGLAQALGIASSRCGGLFSNIGTMTKASHCGYAASFGVEAALLASRGFTANSEMFDVSAQGYVHAFLTEGFDPTVLLGYGAPFRVIEPGFAIKLFPCKFTTHYAVNAAIDAYPRIPSRDAIASVNILTAHVPSANRPKPMTGLEGKFSVQYTAAAGLLDGKVDLATFSDERLQSADMQDLLGRINLTMSSEISSKYTAGRYLEMSVHLKDGSVIKERCDMPRGAWGTPPPTREEHLIKVRSCLGTALPGERVEAIISRVDTLDIASAADIGELVRLGRVGSRMSEVGHAAD